MRRYLTTQIRLTVVSQSDYDGAWRRLSPDTAIYAL